MTEIAGEVLHLNAPGENQRWDGCRAFFAVWLHFPSCAVCHNGK